MDEKKGRFDYLLLTQIILTINFIVLKVSGVLTWSWIWVLCPLWIGLAVYLVIMLVLLAFCLIVVAINDNIDMF